MRIHKPVNTDTTDPTLDNDLWLTEIKALPDHFLKLVGNRLALRVTEIPTLLPIGRTRVYEEINAGRLKAYKCGISTLVKTWDLLEWIDKLPPYQPGVATIAPMVQP